MGVLAGVHQRGTWSGPFNFKDPALNEIYGMGARTQAGPLITELTAFMCAAFWNGVDQISSDVGKMPLNLLIRLDGGGSEPYIKSKTYKLLKFRPNPETGSLVLRRTMTAHALVYGNGYAEIVRDGIGRPTSLWLLHPKRVRPFYTNEQEKSGLRYLLDGEKELSPMDVLHINGLSDDAVVGYNLVSIAREALGLALASQQFASAFFGNGTRFGGVLSTEQEIDADQEKEIRERVEAIHAKADRAFRLLVLGGGFKFEGTGTKPNDAQMSEIRDQQVQEIARFLNMPLHKLKLAIPGAVSYASVEMADLDYYKGPILTWSTVWEQELDAKLIPSLEWSRQYFRHNSNAFLRGDIKSRYEALGIALDKGVINANQWRELEDMNPQEGQQGNLYFIQSGFIPKNKSEELVQSQIDKNNQPPAAPPSPGGNGGDSNAVREAIERFDAAQALVEEARAKYQTEHDARVAAESVTSTTKEELLRRMTGEAEARIALQAIEVIAADRAADVDRLKAALSRAEAELAGANESGEVAREALARASQTISVQQSRLEELDAELRAARAAEAEAVTRAADASALAVAAEQIARDATSEREALKAAAAQARTDADAAQAEAVTLEQERQRLEAAWRDADTLARETSQYAEALKAAAVASADVVAALQASDEARRREMDDLARSLAAATDRALGAETRASALETAGTTAAAEAKAKRAAEIARLTALIASIRALIVDVMRRLVERETDRARSRQQSPEKLRAWVATFYGSFEESFVDAILPAIRVHLSWKGSTEDQRDMAASLAQRYCEDSKRQLSAFFGSTTDDFQVAVDHLLRRWEKDRPDAIADALLEEEIAHLRELERNG